MEYFHMPSAAGNGLELVKYEDIIFPVIENLDILPCIKYAKEFEYRPGDILLCTYPKSGTHWMGNTIWRLKNLDNSSRPMDSILEFGPPEVYENMDSPRIMFTHLKPSRLPTEHIKNRGKIVLMLRNPKDVFVSFYYHLKNATFSKSKQTWDELFESHMSGRVAMGSYFDYVQQWEEFIKENPDQQIEIFYYEDVKVNRNDNLTRLNELLGFDRDQEYLERVKELTTFSALKEQDAPGKRGTHYTVKDENGDSVIYRKGEVGGWKDHFKVAQSEQVDKIMETRLKHGIINIKYCV